MRRVVHFQERRDPVELSCFSCLPRDVVHLVLVNLTLPVLCGLKRVSRGVANACRRSLCSEEFIQQDINYNAMSEVIETCAFSFPMRVFVERRTRDSENLWCDVKNPLVIHEFELMFLLDNKIVGVNEVRAWLHELLVMEVSVTTIHRMRVMPIKLCIETTDGVFYSERTLREHMGLDYETSFLCDFGAPKKTFKNIHLLELAARLTPYAMVGGCQFVVDCEMFYDMADDRSLFYCLLCGRLCSK
jgi:hypothetical protein